MRVNYRFGHFKLETKCSEDYKSPEIKILLKERMLNQEVRNHLRNFFIFLAKSDVQILSIDFSVGLFSSGLCRTFVDSPILKQFKVFLQVY